MLANKHTVTPSVSLNPFFYYLKTFALKKKKKNFPLTKKKKKNFFPLTKKIFFKNIQNIIE